MAKLLVGRVKEGRDLRTPQMITVYKKAQGLFLILKYIIFKWEIKQIRKEVEQQWQRKWMGKYPQNV
jgi:hypothetical protein